MVKQDNKNKNPPVAERLGNKVGELYQFNCISCGSFKSQLISLQKMERGLILSLSCLVCGCLNILELPNLKSIDYPDIKPPTKPTSYMG